MKRQSVSPATLGLRDHQRTKAPYSPLASTPAPDTQQTADVRHPDDHVCETAHNPGFDLRDDGSLFLPTAATDP